MRKPLSILLFIVSVNTYAAQDGGDVEVNRAKDARGANTKAALEMIRETNKDPSPSNVFLHSSSVNLQSLWPVQKDLDNELAIAACDIDDNVICDATPSPVPKDYMDFLTSFSIFKNKQKSLETKSTMSAVAANCECVKSKVRSNNPGIDFKESMTAKRKEINDKILEAYGRKFINDFSSNIEDISFFLGRTASMFSSEELGKSLQCNNKDVYNVRVSEVCASRGITDFNFINERKNKFINTLGGNVPFDQRLGVMSREIMGAKITSDFEGSSGQVYARENFDSLRMGLALSDPRAKFVDVFISQILRNNALKAKISQAVLSNMSPVEAILKVTEDEKSSAAFADLGLGANANEYLKDRESLATALTFMMKVHPGFLHVMKDKSAFSNLKIAYGVNPQLGIIDQLKDKSVLEPILVDNCKSMVESFANAVCTKDQDLIGSMDPVDLQLLLQAGKPALPKYSQRSPDISDVLICESKTSMVSASDKFSELANLLDRRLRSTSSDYYERVTSAAGAIVGARMMATDAFSQTANLAVMSRNAQAAIDKLSEVGRRNSVSVSAGGVVSKQVQAENVMAGVDMKSGSGSMGREEARKYLAEAKVWDDKKAVQTSTVAASSSKEVVTPTQAVQDQGYSSQSTSAVPQVTPAANNQYAATPVAPSTTQQAREALRQYIADKNDPEIAKEAVEALDDSTAVELNRLRSENVTLLEKTLKNETEKFEEMKKRIADLEKSAPVKAPVALNEDKSEAPLKPSLSNLRQSFAAAPVKTNQTASRSIASVSGQFSTSPSVSTNEPRSQGRGPKTISETAPQSAGLTVTAFSPGRDADVKPQELQQEVQKLLDNPNLNQSSLEEIKSKGFLYRYSVVENNETVQKEVLIKFDKLDKVTRDAIELKLTRKSAENQVSKLATLKLLISSSTKR